MCKIRNLRYLTTTITNGLRQGKCKYLRQHRTGKDLRNKGHKGEKLKKTTFFSIPSWEVGGTDPGTAPSWDFTGSYHKIFSGNWENCISWAEHRKLILLCTGHLLKIQLRFKYYNLYFLLIKYLFIFNESSEIIIFKVLLCIIKVYVWLK